MLLVSKKRSRRKPFCFFGREEEVVFSRGNGELINRGAVEEGPVERVGKYGGRSDIGPVRGTKRRQSND